MMVLLSRTLSGQPLPVHRLIGTARSTARAYRVFTASSAPSDEPIKYPIPPFTEETAKQKAKAAQVRLRRSF